MNEDSRTQAFTQARSALEALGLSRYAGPDRNVVAFLAFCGHRPGDDWSAIAPLALGITPIMDFVREHYGIDYAPNTRETIRKDAVKPLERLRILIRNPDDPGRPTNSPATDYALDPVLVEALRRLGTPAWGAFAKRYRERMPVGDARPATRRVSVPVALPGGKRLALSPGAHSELIRSIIEDFTHYFTPAGAQVAYVGDTADNTTIADAELLTELGIDLAAAAQKPDVILWYPDRRWLIYLEAVYSSGHFDDDRKEKLSNLSSRHPPIYVSCFVDRRSAARAFVTMAAQSEVWIAEEPSHLIHFDGERFLGPYR